MTPVPPVADPLDGAGFYSSGCLVDPTSVSATPAANGCRWNSVTGEPIGPCAWLDTPVRRQR